MKFLEKIFSIKNEIKNKRKYKVITFLGFKIKFRQKSYDLEQQINMLSEKLKKQNIQSINQQKYINEQQRKLLKQDEKIKKLSKSLEKYTLWQNNFYREIPLDFPIMLSLDEKEFLIKYFKNSKNYLEFGAGGSTFLALLNSNCNIISVESDLDWINYLCSYKFIRNSEDNRLKLNHIDIGKTKNYGAPLNDDKKENYPQYSKDVFQKINPKEFDLVFIDGRFRVACALQTILNCSKDVKILIHDYPKRKYYHIIEEFLDVAENADTLYSFKIKDNIDVERVKELYEEYKYEYA